MSENNPRSAMRAFFVSLGFTQARIDNALCDQLLDSMVAGLASATPNTPESQKLTRELAERLSALQIGTETLEPLKRDFLVPDEKNEASLRSDILSARDRVLKEIDAENARLAQRQSETHRAA